MSEPKALSKNQLVKAIEKLEKNPYDKLTILSDLGIGVVGAGAAGSAVAAFGGTSILFGLVTVAPPVGLVVGGAALGAVALVGVKRILIDGTFNGGKKAELLKQMKEQLKEVEAKEKSHQLDESDKTQFIILLKEPIQQNLISPEDAQALIEGIESGHISLSEGIQMVREIIESIDVQPAEAAKQLEPSEECGKTEFSTVLEDAIKRKLISHREARSLIESIRNDRLSFAAGIQKVREIVKLAETQKSDGGDKAEFIALLEDAVKQKLISPPDALSLIRDIKRDRLSFRDGIQKVREMSQ